VLINKEAAEQWFNIKPTAPANVVQMPAQKGVVAR